MKIIRINSRNKHLLNDINRENATVLFYHPSCIHCMMMRQNWESMKRKLQNKKKPCNIYEVNGEHMDSIQHPLKEKIQGFPTIMNVRNGKLLDYFEKERNIENMMNYVLSNQNKGSSNNLKSRVVRFSINPNGSLSKTRKVLNSKKLMNSITLRKQQQKNNKTNKRKPKQNKRKTEKPVRPKRKPTRKNVRGKK